MREIIKVNLGCGSKAVKGWINLDKSWKIYLSRFSLLKIPLRFFSALGLVNKITPNEEIPAELGVRRYDVTKGLPFNDNTVDYIYTSHMLEHLRQDKANFVLRECYRILKIGGILRIIVPDLNLLVNEYIKGKQDGDVTAADRFMKGMGLIDTGNPRPPLNRILGGKHHQWMYDFESLAYRLLDIGFKEIEKCEPGGRASPDPQLLGEGGLHPDSLYLEAKK